LLRDSLREGLIEETWAESRVYQQLTESSVPTILLAVRIRHEYSESRQHKAEAVTIHWDQCYSRGEPRT
jgi:hypothetical protein